MFLRESGTAAENKVASADKPKYKRTPPRSLEGRAPPDVPPHAADPAKTAKTSPLASLRLSFMHHTAVNGGFAASDPALDKRAGPPLAAKPLIRAASSVQEPVRRSSAGRRPRTARAAARKGVVDMSPHVTGGWSTSPPEGPPSVSRSHGSGLADVLGGGAKEGAKEGRAQLGCGTCPKVSGGRLPPAPPC